MKSFVVLALFVSVTAGFIPDAPELWTFRSNPLFPQGRIVGGHDIDIVNVPYVVSLEYKGAHYCGGALISDKYVLTAAHCIIGAPDFIKVRAGTSRRENGGVLVGVKSIHTHPNYEPNRTNNDAAIIVLNKNIELSNRIRPTSVIDAEPAANSLFQVSGWGHTTESGILAQNLQTVMVPVVTRRECQKSYDSYGVIITDAMICAYSRGKDSCQGDSGGPAVFNGKIGGIVSWGVGCARPNIPGVYTNVGNPIIRNFIRKVTNI